MTADPLAGDPGAVRAVARGLEERADGLRDATARLSVAVGTADATWRGAAHDAFIGFAERVEPAARRVAGRAESVAGVLTAYAREVERVQDEARGVLAARATAAHDAESRKNELEGQWERADRADAVEADHLTLAHLMSGLTAAALLLTRLETQWGGLAEERARIDRRAAADLASSDVLGSLASLAGIVAGGSDRALLAALRTLGPEEIAALGVGVGVGAGAALAGGSAFADRLAAMPADRIARWWDSMGGRGSAAEHSAEQAALIAALPTVIGVLDGVAYWARDRGNRIALAQASAVAHRVVVRRREQLASAIGRTAQAAAQRALAEAQRDEAALRNFRAGGGTALDLRRPVVRQMVSFHLGPPARGAFSIGDLDTVRSVTYLVPGMGSSLASTTEYMRASANVLRLHQRDSPLDHSAVVTWLGYEAPPSFLDGGDLSVLGDGHAERGAPLLAADLAGLRATRADVGINVVAHSYGSTVAAVALASDPSIGVRSFVTLGSAGIPSGVPDAAATHVGQMYAAQAAEFGDVAFLGRKYSGRADPADGFGASVIGTSSGERVDQHALLANSTEHPGRHGYLDAGTNTLAEVARVTAP